MARKRSPSCIFCDIVAGRRECAIVWRGKRAAAVMDRSPVRRGHVLVLSASHVPHFEDLDSAEFAEIMKAVRRLAKALRATLPSKKIGVLIAGFDVAHTHVHVIPIQNRRDVATRRVFEDRFE